MRTRPLPRRQVTPTTARFELVLAAVAVLLSACQKAPLAENPAVAAPRAVEAKDSYYPLAVGNSWTFHCTSEGSDNSKPPTGTVFRSGHLKCEEHEPLVKAEMKIGERVADLTAAALEKTTARARLLVRQGNWPGCRCRRIG